MNNCDYQIGSNNGTSQVCPNSCLGLSVYLFTPDDGGRDGEEVARLHAFHGHRRLSRRRHGAGPSPHLNQGEASIKLNEQYTAVQSAEQGHQEIGVRIYKFIEL